jgi:predicted nucleic acid-binding protein
MDCFVDTSGFYAYLVAADAYHQPVAAYLQKAVRDGRVLFSSSLVLGETLGLLQMRHGVSMASRYMAEVYPLVVWRWIDEPMMRDIWRLVDTRRKRSFTAVDASAVVCIGERPGSVCVAVDDDLRAFDFDVFPVLSQP